MTNDIACEMILTDKKTEIILKDFDELETAFDTLLVLNEKEETFEDCYGEKDGQLQLKVQSFLIHID